MYSNIIYMYINFLLPSLQYMIVVKLSLIATISDKVSLIVATSDSFSTKTHPKFDERKNVIYM